MPQIFQVLRCYKCLVFQVHQTKKSNKWKCKLCGEKQSVKRHYGLGTAKDCRVQVQRLNGMRSEIDELKCKQEEEQVLESENKELLIIQNTCHKGKNSKWSSYIDTTEDVEENVNDTDTMCLGDVEVVLELPKKRKKPNNRSSKRHPVVLTPSNKIQANIRREELPDTGSKAEFITVGMPTKINHTELPYNDLVIKGETSASNRTLTKKKFTPPVLNKSSKWAQFTDSTEDTKEDSVPEISPSASFVSSQNEMLFSLCDDNDLDNILNI